VRHEEVERWHRSGEEGSSRPTAPTYSHSGAQANAAGLYLAFLKPGDVVLRARSHRADTNPRIAGEFLRGSFIITLSTTAWATDASTMLNAEDGTRSET